MILPRVLKSLLKPLVLSVVCLSLHSCALFTEPEPYVNKDAHPTVIDTKPLYVTNYSEDQIVTGEIAPNFIPDIDISKIEKVKLVVDTTVIGTVLHLPFVFSFNSRNWPNGEHSLHFGLYLKGDNLGLMKILDAPSQIYTRKLIFDDTPPTAPSSITFRYEAGHTRISWNPVTDANFSSYVVLKYNVSGYVGRFDVYSRSAATFLDTTELVSIGSVVEYRIGTSNNAETAYAPQMSNTLGTSLKLGTANIVVDNMDDRVVFLVDNQYLTSVSTATTATLATSNKTTNVGMITLNYDKTKLFMGNTSGGFSVFDSRTFQFESNVGTNIFSYDAYAVGLNSLLFLARDSVLSIENALNNTIVFSTAYFLAKCNSLRISPSGAVLLAADGNRISRFSIIGDSVALISQYSNSGTTGQMKVDWARSKLLYVNDNTIVKAIDINAMSYLNSTQTQYLDGHIANIVGTTLSSDYFLVAYEASGATYALLVECDAASFQQIRSWRFAHGIQSIGTSNNGIYVFICTAYYYTDYNLPWPYRKEVDDQWMVNISGTP